MGVDMTVGDVYDLTGKRVLVCGHRGMVGSAIVRRLAREACTVLTVPRVSLDLRRQSAVETFMEDARPDVVVLAAATVGGIHANMTRPADFILDNLMIQTNVLDAAWRAGVEKFLFLGTSCIYPREAEVPISEEALLTGPLEKTNEPYAIAKIAGLRAAQALRRQHGFDAITAMPCNLYGPYDSFEPEKSHVMAALLRRFHDARLSGATEAVVWGSGRPRREFLFIDDLADACVFLLRRYSAEAPVNVGTGEDQSIAEIARMVARVTGFEGALTFDTSQPDGTARKLTDSSRMSALGWRPLTSLEDGLRQTYDWFLESIA